VIERPPAEQRVALRPHLPKLQTAATGSVRPKGRKCHFDARKNYRAGGATELTNSVETGSRISTRALTNSVFSSLLAEGEMIAMVDQGIDRVKDVAMGADAL
jgi:hypothetical protein